MPTEFRSILTQLSIGGQALLCEPDTDGKFMAFALNGVTVHPTGSLLMYVCCVRRFHGSTKYNCFRYVNMLMEYFKIVDEVPTLAVELIPCITDSIRFFNNTVCFTQSI